MNKEEQEAIEFLKFSLLDYEELDTGVLENIDEKRKTLLNYIDKLQKELKDSINARFELQRRIDRLQEENEQLKSENNSYADILNAEIKDYDTLKGKYDKLQKENEVLKEVHKEFATLCRELKTDDTLMSAKSVMEKVVSKDKIKEALDYIEENSFEDTTGVVLNLQDESYWKLWKILKGE